jgi:WD40 repeat protein
MGQILTGHTGEVHEVAFNPDSPIIASGSRDRTVRLWDAVTGTPIGQPLTGHAGEVLGVAFSPDGKMIASANWDHTVRLWPVTPGRWVKHACTLAKHTSRKEWNEFVNPGRPYVRTCPNLPSGYGAPLDAPSATYDHLD